MVSFDKKKADLVNIRQLGWLLITVQLSTGIIFVQRSLAQATGKSGWVTILIAGLGGLLLLRLIMHTQKYYPNQSLIEYAPQLLGKWAGNFISIIYLGVLFYLLLLITYEAARLAELNYIYVYINPIIIMSLAYLFLVIYMVTGGISVIVRVNDMVFPLFFILLAVTLILNLPFINMDRILPLTPANWQEVFKTVPLPFIFFAETTLLSLIWPYCREDAEVKKGIKFIGASIIVSMAVMIIVFLSLIVTFGTERTSFLDVPIYFLAREIFFGQFLSNFQILLLPVLLGSIIIKIAVFVFVIGDGVKQLGWKKYNWLLPYLIGLLTMVLSFSLIESDNELTRLIHQATLWAGPFFPGLHLLLFLVNLFKQRKKRKT